MSAVSVKDASLATAYRWQGAKIKPAIGVVGIGLLLWFLNPPNGINLQTWHLFAIFMATIVGLILKPLPMGAMAMLAIGVAASTNTLSLKQCLSAFGSDIVWLIVCAFLLARGFIKTGLGSRVAYYFISMLGKSTLGVSYGLITTEFLLSPFMPSNTARGAGIVYPIIASLNKEYKSTPEQNSERKIGSYLVKLLFQVNCVTSAMFMTATAANPLIAGVAMDNGVALDWTTWAIACSVPGIVNLALLPLFLYYIHKPELMHTPDAPQFAKQKLQELGSLKVEEIMMIATFGLLLILWVFGSSIGVNATTAALIGLGILLFTGVLNWDDVTKEKGAWDTFIWMAVLIMLSSQLTQMGMMSIVGQNVQSILGDINWISALLIVSLIYFYSHYFFASMTAHVTALYSALLIVTISAGAPPMFAVLVLAVFSSLCAGITHYGTGSAPVYFGGNYLNVKEWWKIGGIVSIFNLLIWLVVGSAWWKLLGYW